MKKHLESQKDNVERPAEDDAHAGMAAAVALAAAPALQQKTEAAPHPIPEGSSGVCPVMHRKADGTKVAPPAEEKEDLKIHRLYDTEKHPSLVFNDK